MGQKSKVQLDRARERQTMLWLSTICGVLIAAGLALTLVAQATPHEPAVTLGDVSGAQIVEIRDHRGVDVMSGEFRSRVDALGNTEKDAALLDRRGDTAIGEVELEIPAEGRADRRPELEVDIIGLAPRERFSVVIDDRIVAVFNTDDRGTVDMEIQEGEAPAELTLQ
jgi:hypothetical protein